MTLKTFFYQKIVVNVADKIVNSAWEPEVWAVLPFAQRFDLAAGRSKVKRASKMQVDRL